MSVDWLNQRSFDALGSFVLWSLDSILADLASHQGTGKSSKKVVQQASSKSQVTSKSFLTLYMLYAHLMLVYMQVMESIEICGIGHVFHILIWKVGIQRTASEQKVLASS